MKFKFLDNCIDISLNLDTFSIEKISRTSDSLAECFYHFKNEHMKISFIVNSLNSNKAIIFPDP